ncbi:hypothetical protein Back2_17760 [Nocardioides baekrokdamisoli]|uniref:HNH domain-containing protein n=1 Tax=Nocardioides baekrokdamisoli TaxID=1804624 RepID=A0A3G9J3A7_9ACTN|nr:HNH endonuclease [Nocardioides baekrokdamisoli]BBH17489.1 hypothetical protein Back2_17760 [Nocardioides baekrokdamisoli]
MTTTSDPRGTRAWRALRDRVVAEEPDCTLRLPGCTRASQTGDHIKPVETHPHLALERTNVRGACTSCNRLRGSIPNESLVLGDPTTHRARALDIFRPLTP